MAATGKKTRNAEAGNRLRAVREAQGKSLEQVARATGYDKAYLSRVERGAQRPSVDLLAALAEELGLKDLAQTLGRFWKARP